MFVAFSLPDLTKYGKSQKIKEGEEDIGVDIVDALVLAEILNQSSNGNQDQKNCVGASKGPVESNTFSKIISNFIQRG